MWPVFMVTDMLKPLQCIDWKTGNQRSHRKLPSKAGPKRPREAGRRQRQEKAGRCLGIKYWDLVHRDGGLASLLRRPCDRRQGPNSRYWVRAGS